MKILIFLLISINILIANQTNVVKTSELELFLFKVGFESLLKDVDITKEKSNLNESEIVKLNSKIEIIMNELYKDKRVLTNDSKRVVNINTSNENIKKEILILKDELSILKKQINKLTGNKKAQKIVLATKDYKIRVDSANIRSGAFPNAKVIDVLNKETVVSIEYCNSYGWCKLKGEKKFVSRFLLKK
jgi:hypothetical protein